MRHFNLTSFDGLELYCTRYDAENPQAVIMLVHGMREHSGRYQEFAETLAQNGFSVVTSDNRGHGKTMKDKATEYGFGKHGDIYGETIKDQLVILDYVKREFPNLPIYLFGHSYGSMLSQTLVQICPEFEKVVLQGSTCGDNKAYKFGKFVAHVLKFFGQDNKPGRVFENAGMKKWNKEGGGNWLSRDPQVYEEYLADDLCHGAFPISFYRSLMEHMTQVNKGIGSIRPNQKILLLCGSRDPVGEYGKQVYRLYQKYVDAGVDAKLIIYGGAKHELHHETNKDEVIDDLLEFYR